MNWQYFVDIIDTLSPLVTLGFGIYGATNDTKPKDGKLSYKGRIALFGLIISGLITIVIKAGNLHNKIVQQKEQLHKQDSINTVQRKELQDRLIFQDSVSTNLKNTLSDLSNIRDKSQTTLNSLNEVATDQKTTLLNTRRGLNPLLPLQVVLDFSIDMNEFYKKYPSTSYRDGISQYLDTLVYFAAKAKIPELIRIHNHTGSPLDTTNIPKENTVDPLLNHTYFSIPENVLPQLDHFRRVFTGLFLIKGFEINLRKKTGANSQLTLSFKVNDLMEKILNQESSEIENERLHTEVDMKAQLIHVELLVDNPEIILAGSKDDFNSLYDLQNSIMGLHIDNSLVGVPAIFKLNQILIFTGHKFSRKTIFKYAGNNVQNICCNEVYAREIKPEEIK